MQGMMQNLMMGPFWGMVAISVVGGLITLACFAVMFRFIFHPGETDPRHPKYQILRRDR
ncbi:MAG TPA: hypothetical protein VFJ87_00495 [Rhodanobacteraceae bacterium]|jgi:hypothetical protein|nr:hypothetical protein [Rhodanobacteraceae bacterium]